MAFQSENTAGVLDSNLSIAESIFAKLQENIIHDFLDIYQIKDDDFSHIMSMLCHIIFKYKSEHKFKAQSYLNFSNVVYDKFSKNQPFFKSNIIFFNSLNQELGILK